MRVFGQRNYLRFENDEEYYEAIGYLSSPNRDYYISCEQYHNKWGTEYRINFYNITNMPDSLRRAISAGNNTYVARLNNNEFIHTLINEHNFPVTGSQDFNNVLSTIPVQYFESFNRGYIV